MEKRILGKTGEQLSIIGFGGVVVMDETARDAARYVSRAIERGINYFDVAPYYGNAEQMLGPALKPYRKEVFLACKTEQRTAAQAREALQESLKRLKTDHLDLYQLHNISILEDVDTVSRNGGVLELFQQAREDGIVRYLGFSTHNEEAALTMMERFSFDSVLFPVNWSSWLKRGFGQRIMPRAKEQGIGRLALKALAKRKWRDEEESKQWPKCWYAPVENREEAELALRFTLSQPVTAAVSPGHFELLEWACDVAEHCTPLNENELETLWIKSQELDTIFPEQPEVA